MLVKPLKDEEIKTHKMSDAILTSSNKNDDKTHLINEAAKKMHIPFNALHEKNARSSKMCSSLCQKHFFIAGSAPELPLKAPIFASLHAFFDKSEGSFNRTHILLNTTDRKIINSTQCFPLFS